MTNQTVVQQEVPEEYKKEIALWLGENGYCWRPEDISDYQMTQLENQRGNWSLYEVTITIGDELKMTFLIVDHAGNLFVGPKQKREHQNKYVEEARKK